MCMPLLASHPHALEQLEELLLELWDEDGPFRTLELHRVIDPDASYLADFISILNHLHDSTAIKHLAFNNCDPSFVGDVLRILVSGNGENRAQLSRVWGWHRYFTLTAGGLGSGMDDSSTGWVTGSRIQHRDNAKQQSDALA
ncbi:hypothetical protein P691DRAFT_544372 [Macrolepiota fuliginosa MF-IS2]|uniref:Uncharacterized protein n=1 Tax=Macrolepiota fuliginosa MF-IS2 TaxID=1400762 RepID=A0A9P5X018_9AGAR|nr:hypothetical protein P691DRAFT_544372 [Macrolepiota fuliginosa MF-IS2]